MGVRLLRSHRSTTFVIDFLLMILILSRLKINSHLRIENVESLAERLKKRSFFFSNMKKTFLF